MHSRHHATLLSGVFRVILDIKSEWRRRQNQTRRAVGNYDPPLFFLIAIKRLAFCLRVSGFVSPPIHQALATDATQEFIGAHTVIDAKGRTVRVAEIKLGKVAAKVCF